MIQGTGNCVDRAYSDRKHATGAIVRPVSGCGIPIHSGTKGASPMFSLKSTVVGLVLAASLVATTVSARAAGDIVDTATKAGNFTTLVAAVKAAGLVDTLKGPGPFTVFAPTDEAFKKLPAGTLESLLKPENKEQLVGILTYHVVPGSVDAAKITGNKQKQFGIKSVQGAEIPVDTRDGVKVSGANVTKTDINASNGVIHVIDAVILPPEKS